jgi:hypothetical protein
MPKPVSRLLPAQVRLIASFEELCIQNLSLFRQEITGEPSQIIMDSSDAVHKSLYLQ